MHPTIDAEPHRRSLIPRHPHRHTHTHTHTSKSISLQWNNCRNLPPSLPLPLSFPLRPISLSLSLSLFFASAFDYVSSLCSLWFVSLPLNAFYCYYGGESSAIEWALIELLITESTLCSRKENVYLFPVVLLSCALYLYLLFAFFLFFFFCTLMLCLIVSVHWERVVPASAPSKVSNCISVRALSPPTVHSLIGL